MAREGVGALMNLQWDQIPNTVKEATITEEEETCTHRWGMGSGSEPKSKLSVEEYLFNDTKETKTLQRSILNINSTKIKWNRQQ